VKDLSANIEKAAFTPKLYYRFFANAQNDIDQFLYYAKLSNKKQLFISSQLLVKMIRIKEREDLQDE
jgi:hypothetical protein